MKTLLKIIMFKNLLCFIAAFMCRSAYADYPGPLGVFSLNSGVAPGGLPLCAVGTKLADGGSFGLIVEGDNTTFDVVLINPTWNFPQNTSITATYIFEGNSFPLHLSGQGRTDGVDFKMDEETMVAFSLEFTTTPTLDITFPDSNLQAWTVPLDGSARAWAALGECQQNYMHNSTQAPNQN